MTRIILSFLWLCIVLTSAAQEVLYSKVPTLTGYDITINHMQTKYTATYYLVGNEGANLLIIDSCISKKGVISYKNKKNIIPCGVYTITTDPSDHFTSFEESYRHLPIILNKSNRCQADWNGQEWVISNNEESLLLNTFLRRWTHAIASVSDASNMTALFDEYSLSSHNSLLSIFISARRGYFAHHPQEDITCSKILKDLPYTDLSEPLLLHTPISLFLSLEKLPDCFPNDADNIIPRLDSVLDQCHSDLIKNFLIAYLFQQFDEHNPDYDPILVHLYDHYGDTWIEEENRNRIERKINNLRKILPGASIPELISHDKEGLPHSTHDIKAHYTILWFWDPDCDHCQEMPPLLHQMYQEHGIEADFEVFAVEVNDAYDRWIAFSNIHNLWDWHNLSVSMGEESHDFIEYFDIMTTPVMFLIDNTKNYAIIARQISLDEMREMLHIAPEYE